MKYNSKIIRRKTQSSLKQIKHYIEKGILRPEILSDVLLMNDQDIERLYHIKLLLEIGFNLEHIKIILDNINKQNLITIFDHFLDSYKTWFEIFNNKYEIYKDKNLIKLDDRSYFGFFKSELIARTVMYELYEKRYLWYQKEEYKIKLKKIRKNIYSCFKEFNDNKLIYEMVSKYFSELYEFLNDNFLNRSPLYFICWIKWLTNEPRYIKEMRRITQFNYSNEIFEMSLIWIIKITNKKY
ncbi:MerR family transcriptional regulator [Spiroplasma culicicola]|uniref:HTH merR-type domain-containing protein n=1 Tax=Spiroplasma culicicola AES-1 TaxID=1276246 RepID=W6A7P2_9MOLU|nr:MerR family transcriptional regulator [Spiroplasma culicicola]AHI53006.1 hypothetical protein SCULI_v1c06650 [Spiroplasma culicicola AES-1]